MRGESDSNRSGTQKFSKSERFIPKNGYICKKKLKHGTYTLRLIRGWKVNWFHVGSIPTVPTKRSNLRRSLGELQSHYALWKINPDGDGVRLLSEMYLRVFGSIPMSSTTPVWSGIKVGSYPTLEWFDTTIRDLHGVCSSVGRALDCGSRGRGFDPHHTHKIVHNGQGLGEWVDSEW